MSLTGPILMYLMLAFFAAMMWPMVRDSFSDERAVFMRMPGETGAEFVGKAVLVGLVWPLPTGFLIYHFVTTKVIPWLTQPKS